MKKYLTPELSVFFPAYNEEENIKNTVLSAISILKEIAGKWEIIVIDDGSKDKTGDLVKEIITEYPKNIRLITHKPNKGYGDAVKSGMYNSRYQWIAFTDSDGQLKFSEINKFIKKANESDADIVIGYRVKRADSLMRLTIAWMLKIWNLFLYGIWFKDADCAFKFFKKEIIDTIPKLQTGGAMTTTEFLIKTKRAGFKFAEVGVNHYPRTAGKQTGGSFKVIWRAIKESFYLWKILH